MERAGSAVLDAARGSVWRAAWVLFPWLPYFLASWGRGSRLPEIRGASPAPTLHCRPEQAGEPAGHKGVCSGCG